VCYALLGVIFCLDFDHFFFLPSFPCQVLFSYLFIYFSEVLAQVIKSTYQTDLVGYREQIEKCGWGQIREGDNQIT
jgi:hypothetical protein